MHWRVLVHCGPPNHVPHKWKPNILGMSQKLKAIMNIYISLHWKGPQAISHPLLLSRHNLPPLLSACICHQSHKLWVFVHWEEGYMFFPSIYELVMRLFSIHRRAGYVTFYPSTRGLWGHFQTFAMYIISLSTPVTMNSTSVSTPQLFMITSVITGYLVHNHPLLVSQVVWLDVRSWVTTHTFNLCFIRDLVSTRYHVGLSLAKWLHNPYMLKWRFHNCSLWMKRGRLDSHKLWLSRATWWRSISFVKLKYGVAVISLAVTGKTLPWCCWLLNKTVQS